jgi:hypothetical protein
MTNPTQPAAPERSFHVEWQAPDAKDPSKLWSYFGPDMTEAEANDHAARQTAKGHLNVVVKNHVQQPAEAAAAPTQSPAPPATQSPAPPPTQPAALQPEPPAQPHG